jgi:hypothetical protein
VREVSRGEFTPSWAIVGGAVGDEVKSGTILAFNNRHKSRQMRTWKDIVSEGEVRGRMEVKSSESRAYHYHVQTHCD